MKGLRPEISRIISTMAVVFFLMGTIAFASPQSDCLDRLTPYASTVQAAGLYPSVYLAQAMLETGWCRSEAVQYNNYWGIKCRGGTCFEKNTWELYHDQYWQGKLLFQAFDSLQGGTRAYIDKITTNPIYSDVDRSNRYVYIATLARHWATDKEYPKKIRRIIKGYNLGRYDSPAVKPEDAPDGNQ